MWWGVRPCAILTTQTPVVYPPMSENQEASPEKKEGMTQRTIKSVLWSSSGTAVQFIANVLVIVILSRLLAPSDFGVVGTAMIVVAFCQIFSQLSIGQAIVQRQDLHNVHIQTGFTISCLSGLLLTTVIYFGAAPFATFFRMEEDGLIPVLQVISMVVLFRGMGAIAEALLQRDLNFRILTKIQIISFTVGYGMVGVVMAWRGFGVWSLVGAQLGQTILQTMMFLLGRPHSKHLQINYNALRELMDFGKGMTVTRVAHYFAIQGDNLVVGRWLGASALGIYSRAYRLMALPANLWGDAIEIVLFSTMSKVQSESARLRIAYQRGISLIALLVMPLSAFVFVFAPELVGLVLGSQWEDTILPLRIMSLGMFFRTGYKMSVSLGRAKGAVNRVARYHVLYGGAILMASLIGQRWGVTGVSSGVVVALAVFYFAQARMGIALSAMRWQQFVVLHLPGLALAGLVFLWSQIVAWGLRQFDRSSLEVLIMGLTAVTILTLPCIVFCPRWLLGANGVWWVQTLWSYLPLPASMRA